MQSECLFKASGSKFDRIFVPGRAVKRSEKETVLEYIEVGLHIVAHSAYAEGAIKAKAV